MLTDKNVLHWLHKYTAQTNNKQCRQLYVRTITVKANIKALFSQ